MKCRDPILCYDRGTKKTFRHFSLATPLHKLRANLILNCGKCIFCRKKKSYELAIRCVLHASLHKQNCFITLTYDEKKESYHNNFQYEDIQKFKKRLRRHCEPKRIKIFNVHEYGKNGKKHWHLVVFNHDFDDKLLHTTSASIPLYTSKTLETLWPYGFNTVGDVTEASAMYQAQYTQKDFKHGNTLNSKKSHSKHSGLGRDYFLQHYEQILRLGYIPFNGRKVPIPRYFEKLAHKHYSHFYAPENFENTKERKRLYTKFKLDEAKRDMADLYLSYYKLRQEKIIELSNEWEETIEKYIYNNEKPEFMKSAENALYDLKNKLNQSNF